MVGHDAGESIEPLVEHLEEALEKCEDADGRYHLRAALQQVYCQKLDCSDRSST
jgi:hypothetical protein